MIIPYLVAIFFAIKIFIASGMFDDIKYGLTIAMNYVGLGSYTEALDLLPLAMTKPLTGGGARGIMLEIFLSQENVPSSEYHPLTIVTSSNLQVGQFVVAIGNPFGLSGSMTFGIISQLGRTIQDPTAGNFSIAGAIQFSAPINPGNSGGALLDDSGLVVGYHYCRGERLPGCGVCDSL